MKAIETRYKGYRFRSRLEARWAVFFDRMQVAWEYEPQGYELGDAGCYLPDFLLAGRLFVEIKPPFDTMTGTALELAQRKAEELARGTGLPVLLVGGEVGVDEKAEGFFVSGDGLVRGTGVLGECGDCGALGYSVYPHVPDRRFDREVCFPTSVAFFCKDACLNDVDDIEPPTPSFAFLSAADAARSARFDGTDEQESRRASLTLRSRFRPWKKRGTV